MAWRKSDEKQYLTNRSMVGSFDGTAIQCAGASLLVLHIDWAAFAGCAGTLSLEGRSPFGARWVPIPVTSGSYGAWPNVGATADSAIVVVQNPLKWMRLVYASTGPGTVDQMNAWRELRS